MTISKDRVKPSPLPDSWKLSEIFATGVVIGTYLAITTVIFFYAMSETSFFAVNASILLTKNIVCNFLKPHNVMHSYNACTML